jgi:hypothetical protein
VRPSRRPTKLAFQNHSQPCPQALVEIKCPVCEPPHFPEQVVVLIVFTQMAFYPAPFCVSYSIYLSRGRLSKLSTIMDHQLRPASTGHYPHPLLEYVSHTFSSGDCKPFHYSINNSDIYHLSIKLPIMKTIPLFRSAVQTSNPNKSSSRGGVNGVKTRTNTITITETKHKIRVSSGYARGEVA